MITEIIKKITEMKNRTAEINIKKAEILALDVTISVIYVQSPVSIRTK